MQHSLLLTFLLSGMFLASCDNAQKPAQTTNTQPDKSHGSAQELFEMGKAFERRREYADALTAYENALEHAPDHVDCLVAKGSLQLRLRNPQSAIFNLSRAQHLQGADQYAHAIHYQLAEAQLQTGVLKDARKNITQFFELPQADTSRYHADALKLKGILKSRH